jgi:hypothetical protein
MYRGSLFKAAVRETAAPVFETEDGRRVLAI